MPLIKVAYLSDYPFSIGFGGKEIQMLCYLKFVNKSNSSIQIKLFNIFNKFFLRRIDIVHFFGHANFWHLIRRMKSNNINAKIVVSPTIYYENNWKFGSLAFKFGNLLPIPNFYKNVKYEIENADLVIVNSLSEKEFLLQNITNECRIEVVYNAIEDDFNNIGNNQKYLFLKKFGLQERDYILSVGMLDERKNTLNMLKAFLNTYEKIKKKLVIIGSFRFLKMKNQYKAYKLIKENKDKIFHIPYISRDSEINLLKSAYYNCAFHLLPSFIETPGISNLEALSFGKNIIVGSCNPVREYFKDRAIYCDPNDVESIEKAILRCNEMEDKPENINFVMQNYVYSKVIHKLVRIYVNLATELDV